MSTDQQQQRQLLHAANAAIRYGLKHQDHYRIDHSGLPEPLLEQRASFVTLRIDHRLRGCIGNLEAFEPLIDSVINNAHSAAFNDPRFPPLTSEEAEQTKLHISLLNPCQPLQFHDEEELLSQLRPDIDGLVLTFNSQQATFLPAVWQQLPSPHQFLNQLKIKAGLSEHFWHPDLQAERYTVEEFSN